MRGRLRFNKEENIVYLTNFGDLFHLSNFEVFWDEEDDWQQLSACFDTIQHLAVPITDIKELGDEKVETIIMGFENLKRLVVSYRQNSES